MLRNIFHKKQKLLDVSRNDWLFIIAGLTVFVSITMATITKFSIWFDESFSAYIIRFNFFDIAKYTSSDVHPPLYYWVLKVWHFFFGSSELGLRSLSLFFGCLSIVTAYLLVNRLFNRQAARFCLPFLVLSPLLIRYSQEARMYTMVVFISLLATLVLTYAVETKNKLPWTIYGVLISLGMWTHYFAAIVWIAHWLWRADNIRRITNKKTFIKKFFSPEWARSHIIAVALFLPWIPFLVKQLIVVQAYGFWIPAVTPDTIPNFLTNIIYYLDVGEVKSWLAFAFIALSVFLAIAARKLYKSQNDGDKKNYRLIMFIAFAPIVTLFLTSMPPLRSSFIDRYLITSAVGISLFVGITLHSWSKKKSMNIRAIPVFVVCVLLSLGVANVWQVGNYNKNTNSTNSTRQIIEKAAKYSDSNQPIIASSPWLFYEAAFYSTDNHQVHFIDPVDYKFGSLDMLKFNDQFKIKDISAFTKEHSVFWYVKYVSPDKFESPNPNWTELQRVSVGDAKSDKSVYTAVQFQANN